MGARASAVLSADGKTLTLENFVESDYSSIDESRLATVEKVVLKGDISNNGGMFSQLAGLVSPTTLDMSGLNPNAFTNNKDYIKNICGGEGTIAYLPTAMTTIPSWSFGGWNVEHIVIPNTVTTIDSNAFRSCNMTTVTIGNGIENVNSGAFFECTNLTDVVFESGLSDVRIGGDNDNDGVFQNCRGLKHITIPEGVKYLGKNAFYDCNKLESVHLPSTLLTIGDQAFLLCQEMSQLVIPKSVTTIGRAAFQLSGLKDIYVMQTDVNKLPKIYPDTSTGDSQGTFIASTQLGTNYESTVVAAVQYCNANYDYNAKFTEYKNSGLSDDAAREKCREELRLIILQYFTEQSTIQTVVLHYPNLPELKAFYDANPNDVKKSPGSNTSDADQPVATYLSETYNLKDEAGNLWPAKGDGSYGDMAAVERNSHLDYTNRIEAGMNPTTGNYDQPSIYGWRQLPIQTSFTDTEVITKLVDDTWYTLCPPCDVSDEQLAIAFNEGFNLAEFDAARIMKVEDKDALVFFFTKVAKSDPDYRKNVLARGGHPYMVHPNKGVTPGTSTERVEAYIAMTLTQPLAGHTYNPVDNTKEVTLTDARGATKVTTGTWTEKVKNDAGEYVDVTRNEIIYEGETKTDHKFTFIGKTDASEQPIGAGNYFLGCERDNGYGSAYYPKFYKETSDEIIGNGGKWTRYTAIIKPSEGVEAFLNTLNPGESSAKKVDVEIGRDDVMQITTDIENVLQEAREQNQPVKYLPVVYNINGQVVRTDSINLDGLPTGLYIVNGKKYFVK